MTTTNRRASAENSYGGGSQTYEWRPEIGHCTWPVNGGACDFMAHWYAVSGSNIRCVAHGPQELVDDDYNK